ncbi:MAG: segregation/condensation protein A [Calditrichaceae bacterium]
MRYRIKLDVFEGPFDLLLFLIRKNEVDIFNIPIAKITEQFITYIEVMKILDLDVAGDFIEMAAILMHIKARMLLPRPEGIEDDYEDPRSELVSRLLEYKQFKEVSQELDTLEDTRRKLFPRKYFKYIPTTEETTTEEYLDDVTLFDLMVAFRKALDNMPKVTYHEVHKIEVTVEEKSELILNQLKENKVVLFQDLVKDITDKIILIVTFIALLELCKVGKISVRQSQLFDDIRIKSAA